MTQRLTIEGDDNQRLIASIDAACDWMEQAYAAGSYSKITVLRQWSKHNPTISGKWLAPQPTAGTCGESCCDWPRRGHRL
ncbi:MAG: hypothetical protein R3C56_36835 [Pirellulaceae bacterium]